MSKRNHIISGLYTPVEWSSKFRQQLPPALGDGIMDGPKPSEQQSCCRRWSRGSGCSRQSCCRHGAQCIDGVCTVPARVSLFILHSLSRMRSCPSDPKGKQGERKTRGMGCGCSFHTSRPKSFPLPEPLGRRAFAPRAKYPRTKRCLNRFDRDGLQLGRPSENMLPVVHRREQVPRGHYGAPEGAP